MKVRALIQANKTSELTSEADDAASARALIEEQVPDGYDLIQVHNRMPRGGRVEATGIIRASAVRSVEADAPDYQTAKKMLLSDLPDGYRILSYQVL